MPACAKFSGVATRKSRKKKEDESGVEKGRLRVHDAFELIRWLALSQPDPRKALAELVQNSLDAGARHVHITRVREKKMTCLKILDDGEGVIPELTRAEALRYIATNIGHSRKRDLSPKQRLELMTQGQYGIRLLGFWSLGDMLEIRSHLPDQKPYRLILHRDRSDFQIEPLRGKLDFHERRTEVVVVNLTKEASAAVAARRASDYLAGELRGQLLGRDVELVVNDKMARGRSPKSLRVRPPRFLGERLDGLGPVDVVGHAGQAPVRLDIHLTGEDADEASPPLALYASGTMVAESFTELAALGLDHPPWTDSRLTGLVDFSGLRVTPGSRRGVIPDDVAYAFAASLTKVEPVLSNLIETKDRERREELDKNVIRDLKRAFRDFYKKRPRYTMLPTEDKGAGAEEAGPGSLVDQETATGPLELDPAQPVHSIRTMDELMGGYVGQDRFQAFLMTAFAGMALLLATIGIYGVVAFSVAQRRREARVEGCARRGVERHCPPRSRWRISNRRDRSARRPDRRPHDEPLSRERSVRRVRYRPDHAHRGRLDLDGDRARRVLRPGTACHQSRSDANAPLRVTKTTPRRRGAKWAPSARILSVVSVGR